MPSSPPIRRPARLHVLLAAMLMAWPPLVAEAVLIDSGDGTGNTTAPALDPGFANVGATTTNFTAVYVRNGWVLTANHVGDQPVVLNGTTYQPLVGSGVRFQNADLTFADLRAYKLQTRPPLPDLDIASTPPLAGLPITMIGNGHGRGPATSWMGIDGYTWLGPREVRWGTNQITTTAQFVLDTHSFTTTFDGPPTPGSLHEADVVNGDSGGAAFVGSGPGAELIGILYARGAYQGQPLSTSLYGNVAWIADLHAYRSDLLAVIDQPECDDGLDNDLDGTIDLADGGCTDPGDTDERGAPWECDNGIDDDFDTFSDYPDDPGCLHPTNLIELPAPEPGVGLGLVVGALALGATSKRRRGYSSRSTR